MMLLVFNNEALKCMSCFLQMGLGKTLQAISVAYYYRSEWPLLIIVPSSLRYSWVEEFEKWLPDVDPAAINLIQSGSDARYICMVYSRLSLSRSRRDPLKHFEISVLRHIRFFRIEDFCCCCCIVVLRPW